MPSFEKMLVSLTYTTLKEKRELSGQVTSVNETEGTVDLFVYFDLTTMVVGIQPRWYHAAARQWGPLSSDITCLPELQMFMHFEPVTRVQKCELSNNSYNWMKEELENDKMVYVFKRIAEFLAV